MKPYFIKDLKPDDAQRIEDRYLVRNADIRDGNNGKKHLYMTLGDASGDIQSVKWSLTPDELIAYSKIEAGMVHINDLTYLSATTAPSGGVKDSGVGREGGRYSMDEYTELKWLTFQTDRKW